MEKEQMIELLRAQNRGIYAMVKMLRNMQSTNEKMIGSLNRGEVVPSEDGGLISQKEVVRIAGAVISRLNAKAGRSFDPLAGGTMALIRRRLEEGRSEADLALVVDDKCEEWNGSAFQRYLRPETLFGDEHFESYWATAVAGSKKQKGFSADALDALEDLAVRRMQETT